MSQEPIYHAIYIQGRGSLRHELSVDKALRSGRSGRLPRSKLPPRTHPWLEGHEFSPEPSQIGDRAIPGFWESDVILGARDTSGLITLVERDTRFVLLGRLPGREDPTTINDALLFMARTLPAAVLRRDSILRDLEKTPCPHFSVAHDARIAFCDPSAPWRPGTNENTNVLVRDFWPRNTNFHHVTDEEISHTQDLLNNRPRETLGFHTPREKLVELLAASLG